MNRLLMFVLSVCLLSSVVFAGSRAEKRQARQEKRIQQGVSSGQLTDKEAAKLEAGQERIEETQQQALADDKVTTKEKKKLKRMQNRQDKNIYRQKHDPQVKK